jgi:hypothetical protein
MASLHAITGFQERIFNKLKEHDVVLAKMSKRLERIQEWTYDTPEREDNDADDLDDGEDEDDDDEDAVMMMMTLKQMRAPQTWMSIVRSDPFAPSHFGGVINDIFVIIVRGSSYIF